MQGMHMHAAAEPVRRTTSDDDEYDACGDAQEYDEFAAREDKAPSPEQDDTYMTHDPARMPSPAQVLVDSHQRQVEGKVCGGYCGCNNNARFVLEYGGCVQRNRAS
jgi:hypothetical protein